MNKQYFCVECGCEVELLTNEGDKEYNEIQLHFIEHLLPRMVDGGIVCDECEAEYMFKNPELGSMN